MLRERLSLDTGNCGAQTCAMDRSGTLFAVGGEDGILSIQDNEFNNLQKLNGHTDTINDVLFDHYSKSIITTSSDASFKIWN